MKELELATILADAMINEIREKDLYEALAEVGDKFQEFSNQVISIFGLKVMSCLLKYVEEDLDNEMTNEEKAKLKVFKNIFNV